jgi:hypothetical protein
MAIENSDGVTHLQTSDDKYLIRSLTLEERKWLDSQGIVAAATAAMAIATVALVIVSCLQWRALNRQANMMNLQLVKMESALTENTKSNLTASRSTLYTTENVIAQREFDGANSSLGSIYAHPAESVTDPKEYCRLRLQLLSKDPAVLAARNVVELNELFQGLNSYASSNRSSGIIALRHAYTHITSIIVQMHAAFDYQRARVFTPEELSTWLGYTTDIGPHPVFLTTLWSWQQQRYMSREFAKTIREQLIKQSPRNREIIGYYYPEMLTSQFLDKLPNY